MQSAVRTAAALAFLGEFLFLAYPLVRRYLKNEGFFPRVFFSQVLSTALIISILWVAYTVSNGIVPLVVTSALLVLAGVGGTAAFALDVLKARMRVSRERLVYAGIIATAIVLAVISAVTLTFSVQGDAYAYYVPIGRYLNLYPGSFVQSYYRFSLARDFSYYALYAHADMLGGQFGSYLFLPIPFILGTITGVVSVSKQLTRQATVPIIAATCYIFSVFFGVLLKFNMFYLGNLVMSIMALFYCHFLLTGTKNTIQKVVLPIATFAMLLLYDYTLLLLIPLALGYFCLQRPRLAFYVTACLAILLLVILSQQNVALGFVRIQQFDLQSLIAFFGLILIVLAGVWGGGKGPSWSGGTLYPMILTYLAAGASELAQRLVNLALYGFMTIDGIALSSPVTSYMKSVGWFYQTSPDIYNTLLSVFFSDIFFGWGLFFTAYAVFVHRGKPATAFFLTVIPLVMLVVTINSNYFRPAEFLAPLIIVFLATGLQALTRKNAVLIGVSISFLALLERAATVFPSLDYEHKSIANPLSIGLLVAISVCATSGFLLLRSSRARAVLPSLWARVQRFSTRIPSLRQIGWRQTASIIIISLCLLTITYNVLVNKYPNDSSQTDASFVNQHILPLIQTGSTVLTVELVHPNFNFYKDVVIIAMAQPWVLETFLELHLANTTSLISWLSSNRVNYVLLDQRLTSSNPDAFSIFNQLSASCKNYTQCNPLYNDGRYVLLQITG